MRPQNSSYLLFGTLWASALVGMPAQGQDFFRIVSNPMELQTSPGVSASAPSGFSGSAGTIFMGLAGTVQDSEVDGGFGVGATYGDSNQFLGGAVTIAVPSVSFDDGGFFEKGSLSASVGHNFEDYSAGLSIGVSGVDLWRSGDSPEEDPSYYLAASQAYNLALPTFVTIGVGNNIYASKDGGIYKTSKTGAFGSVGVFVHPQMSLIVDYVSDETTLATSLVPMPDYPVSVTFGVTELDESLKFVAGIGVGFSY